MYRLTAHSSPAVALAGCTPSRDLPRAPAISHERPRKRGSKPQLAIGNWPRSQAGCRSDALPGGAVLVLADSQQPIANSGYVPDVGVSRQEPALSRQNARQNDGPAEDSFEVQHAKTEPAPPRRRRYGAPPATNLLPPVPTRDLFLHFPFCQRLPLQRVSRVTER
jgi:hypothetical protein